MKANQQNIDVSSVSFSLLPPFLRTSYAQLNSLTAKANQQNIAAPSAAFSLLLPFARLIRLRG
jgi:hypothetical protein